MNVDPFANTPNHLAYMTTHVCTAGLRAICTQERYRTEQDESALRVMLYLSRPFVTNGTTIEFSLIHEYVRTLRPGVAVGNDSDAVWCGCLWRIAYCDGSVSEEHEHRYEIWSMYQLRDVWLLVGEYTIAAVRPSGEIIDIAATDIISSYGIVDDALLLNEWGNTWLRVRLVNDHLIVEPASA